MARCIQMVPARYSRTVRLDSRLAPVFALLLVALGCRDGTAPNDNTLDVTLALDGAPIQSITDTPDGPKISCDVNLIATARGKGTAAWTGAKALWYIGRNRATAVDSTFNSSGDVEDGFGGSGGIDAGETLRTTWTFHDAVPFEVSFSFSYETDKGGLGAATTRFRCGPDPATAVTPSVASITVPTPTSGLKVGDTVSVSYHETSSSGVWVSDVQITGAFLAEQWVGEHLTTNVDRTVKFVIPSGMTPDLPLVVWVRAYDAALDGAERSLQTQLTFTDVTPPTIGLPWNISGQFAVGDTLALTANAYDDNLLGWLVWSLGPPANARDSVAATPGHAYEMLTANVVIRPEWLGTPIASLYVRDAAGHTSTTVSTQPDALRFYPVTERATTQPLVLSPVGDADDMVYDAKRGLMYVGLPNDYQIGVFAPSTMTAQPPIVLSGPFGGMDLSLSGDSLLVAVPAADAIYVFDLTHPSAPPSTLRLTVLDTASNYRGGPFRPSALRIAANGKMLVFLTYPTTSNDQVVEVDLATGEQRVRTDARMLTTVDPLWTRYLGRSPDRSRIYAVGMTAGIYDATSDTFTISLSGSLSTCTGMTFDNSGTVLTRGNEVRDQDLHRLAELYFAGVAVCVAISPDGSTVYETDGGANMRSMTLATQLMIERVPLPLTPDRLFVDPGGDWLLAFKTRQGAKVTRVDLR